ncbi:helix-turn-helix domain-containing protein [Anaerosporobacter sp.]|uniref:helix-turn-helix domain-containing protein n=1 Tax=Anaerosporobacter sp. TaxID=1872529 RepID=UPI00286F661D|nr:helix-turn-helix transcriptional regulator [Anaerosporobacter sp.]
MGLEIIEEYKKKLGLTTAELAERSGIPKGTLDKILSGVTKDPKLETLKAIARVLGLSLDDFDDTIENKLDSYNDLLTVYTRSKNNLSQAEKMKLAQIILSEDEEEG